MKNCEFLKENVIAHRGLHNSYIIENTIPAFIKCIDKNYIIEMDIHILKDGTIIIYHDYTLRRLCGKNIIIESLNEKDLLKYKIKDTYTIPEFSKIINIIDGKIPILIEIKDLNNNVNFYRKLTDILDNYKGLFAIQSSNPFCIKWFLKNRKNYIIGIILYKKQIGFLYKKKLRKIDFISINKKELPIKSNKIILGWTIRSKSEYKKYIKYCDNLICEKFI